MKKLYKNPKNEFHEVANLSDLMTKAEAESIMEDLNRWHCHIKTDISQKKDLLVYSLRETIQNLEGLKFGTIFNQIKNNN